MLTTEQGTHYEHLKQLYVNGFFDSKFDPYILHLLASEVDTGNDPDEIAIPILVRVKYNSQVDLTDIAQVYGRLETIIFLSATPLQLMSILGLPDVEKLEVSRS